MKILIATGLYPPEIGGPATYARLFEERLPRYGIQVSIFPFRNVRHLPSLIRHIAYGWRIFRMSHSVDLILVQDTVSTGFPVAVASFFSGKKFIVRVPGDYAWEQGVQRFGVKENIDDFQTKSYGLAVAVFRVIQKFVIRRALRVIAPSQYLARIVRGWVPTKEIDVIYNGIDISAEMNQFLTKNLIISAGRLVPWKGFAELIAVVAKNKEWRLVIFGSGSQESALMQEIQKADAEDRIEIREQVPHDDLQRQFASASVFVLNSRYEGLSHTLVEAMAVGTPVVATKVGGNSEVVQNGVNGILVSAGDNEGLDKALTQILSDDVLRKKLGGSARERAKEFSIDKTIDATASLLKLCVS